MFWGLNLKPNRKYTQTATKSFHISQAALDAETAQDGANQIFITCENQKFLVCTLRKGAIEQVMLDYNFAEGDEISFQSVGSGNVSLSGYLIIEEDPMNFMNGGDEEEEEEEESEVEMEDLRNALNKKAKAKKGEKAAAKVEDDDDEDEDDSDFDEEVAGAEGAEASEEETDDNVDSEDDDDEEEEDDDENEDDEDDDEEDEEEEEVQQPKAKQPKLEPKQKQQNGVAAKDKTAAAAAPEGKKGKKKEKQQQQQPQQKQAQPQKAAGGERTLTGGVKVEDVRVGNGPEAKTGKRAMVYYEGRLKSNNKVFDSLKQGSGFKFGLGRGEVIKGWDVGVVGMKVGGKRRITCPAHMAYGAKGAPPSIPPNSTLVFEVELKGVN